MVLAIVAFACTSSNIQKESVAVRTRMLNPLIPDSVVIYPDSDGHYRPLRIDIIFKIPCSAVVDFRCGSFNIYYGNTTGTLYYELQDFIIPDFKLQMRDSNVIQIYNEFLKNYISENGSGNITINGDYVYRIYMHGSKYPPYKNVY